MNFFKALFILTILGMTHLSHAFDTTINIEMGKQRSFRYVSGFKRIAVGDPQIADIDVIDDRQLLITPKKPGVTNLMLWHGADSTAPDFQAELMVTASASLQRHALDQLEEVGLHVSEAGEKLKLTGKIETLEAHHQALMVLGDKSESAIDSSILDFDTQVQIDIKIVEVSRRRMQNAGLFLGKNTANTTLALSTPGNLSGVGGFESAGEGALSLLSSGFFPHAQAFNFLYGNASEGILGVVSILENNGFAYTLAEPSLMATSGQSANFLAGGEFPIPVPQGGAQSGSNTIRFKEFGVRVSLTPTVLDRNRIALKVAPEVSELDFTAGIQSGGVAVPALRVRRTDTSISLGDGESFVISGLVSQNTLASVDKFPWLGDIPVLGAFFRSTHIDRNDRELIMVVTPHLVQPLAKGADLPAMPGERFRQYDPNFFQTFFLESGSFKVKAPALSGFSK